MFMFSFTCDTNFSVVFMNSNGHTSMMELVDLYEAS